MFGDSPYFPRFLQQHLPGICGGKHARVRVQPACTAGVMPGVSRSADDEIRCQSEPAAPRNLNFCDFRRILAETERFSRTFFLDVEAPSPLTFPLARFLSQARLHHRSRGTQEQHVSHRRAVGARGVLCCLSLRAITCGCFFVGVSAHFKTCLATAALMIHPHGARNRRLSPPMGCL